MWSRQANGAITLRRVDGILHFFFSELSTPNVGPTVSPYPHIMALHMAHKICPAGTQRAHGNR